MAETVVNRDPPLEGNPLSKQDHKKDGKGHNPQSPRLDEREDNDLAKEGKFRAGIDDDEARHADGGGGGKQGVHEGNGVPIRAHGQPEQKRPKKNRAGKPHQEIVGRA